MNLLPLRSQSLVSLLSSSETDSFSFRQRNVLLSSLSNDEDVVQPGSKGVSKGIPNMDNVEGSRMSFPRCNNTNSSQVMSSSNHTQVPGFKLDEVHFSFLVNTDFAVLQIVSNGIVDLD